MDFLGKWGKFAGATHSQGVFWPGLLYILKKIHELDKNITQTKVYS